MRLLFRTQPEPHSTCRRDSLQHRQRMPRILGIFPPLSNQQCQVNPLQRPLKRLAIRCAIPRASTNDLPMPVAVHSLNSFSTSSISFFDSGYRFLYFSHSFLRPSARRVSLGGVCSVFF